MKPFVSTILILLLIVGCAKKAHEEVVVIESTQTYHRPTCDQVVMARTSTMTSEEAIKKHYSACTYCKPDIQR